MRCDSTRTWIVTSEPGTYVVGSDKGEAEPERTEYAVDRVGGATSSIPSGQVPPEQTPIASHV